jgi:hypothetical protein
VTVVGRAERRRGCASQHAAVASAQALAATLGSSYWHSLERRIADLAPAEKGQEYERWNQKVPPADRVALWAGGEEFPDRWSESACDRSTETRG